MDDQRNSLVQFLLEARGLRSALQGLAHGRMQPVKVLCCVCEVRLQLGQLLL
jgi:hypothetical protein